MKRFRTIILIMLAVLLVATSAVTAFATEGTTASATEATTSAQTVETEGDAKVNGEEVAVGETVTYTFSISDCTQKITGIHMVIFFDQTALSLEEVNADNLTGNTIINDNVNNNGQIIITNSFVNGSKGLDCSEKTTIVTATFKVVAPVETEITYYMPYLYDMDVVNIYDYTFSYDLSIGDVKIFEGEAPVLAGDEELANISDKGDFVNQADGIGDGKPAETKDEEPVDKTLVLTISVVSIIVVAIAVLVIIKVTMNKKSAKNQ